MKLLFMLMCVLAAAPIFSEEESDIQPFEYKNQKVSSFNWNELSPYEFLSFRQWRIETEVKEKTPEWEDSYRSRKNREVVGRFFQCVGTCHIERGEGFFNPKFRSNIYESDEIQTIGESYAWIFLMDGTMVRLSPQSSVTINELNIGKTENFINARINAGNVFWMSRLENYHEENNSRETDALFFPLNLYEANPIEEKNTYSENDLLLLTDSKLTTLNQNKRLNKLIEDNDYMTNEKKTFAILVLPNITLMGYSPVVEAVSIIGGKSFLKKRNFEEQELSVEEGDKENELQFQLRGYENKEVVTIDSGDWLEIDEKGKNAVKVSETTLLNMGAFITKRIPSILVARELLLQRYSGFAFQEEYDRTSLAKNEGYRLWEKSEMDLRLDFIKEYFRRVETTNLLSAAHFTEKMRARGEKVPSTEYTSIYYNKALEKLRIFDPYTEIMDLEEPLNSTSKTLWKKKNGTR
jgi:hypothetical protein